MYYIFGSLIVAVICYFGFFQTRLYGLDALINELKSFVTIGVRWTFVFVLLVALSIMMHQPGRYDWLRFLGLYGAGLAGLAAGRAAIATVMRQWIARGYHTQAVALVGCNNLAAQLICQLETNPFGIRVVGVFDDGRRDDVTNIRGVPKLGDIGDLVEYTKRDLVDTVIITLPVAAKARVKAVI